MKQISEKALNVCTMYHNGQSLTTIAKQYHDQPHNIVQFLDRWYFRVYGINWVRLRERNEARAKELKPLFDEIYKPFVYNRAQLCKLLNCKLSELEFMLKYYNITYLRLQTYKSQKTLCNVPEENFEEYKEYANKHNISIRELACRAINEYILFNQNK